MITGSVISGYRSVCSTVAQVCDRVAQLPGIRHGLELYAMAGRACHRASQLPGIRHGLRVMSLTAKGYSIYATGMLIYQGYVNLHALPTRRHGTDLLGLIKINLKGTDHIGHSGQSTGRQAEGFYVFADRPRGWWPEGLLRVPFLAEHALVKRYGPRLYAYNAGGIFGILCTPSVRCHYAGKGVFTHNDRIPRHTEHSDGYDLGPWSMGPHGALFESVRNIHRLPIRWYERPEEVLLGGLQMAAGLALLGRYVSWAPKRLEPLRTWLDRTWTGSALRYSLHFTTF